MPKPNSDCRATERKHPWPMVRLGDVCEDKIQRIKSISEPRIAYIDIASIDNVQKRVIGVKEHDVDDAPGRAQQVVIPGDVLVSNVRPNLNAVAIVDVVSAIPIIASTGFCVLRVKDIALPEYVYYYAQTSDFIDPLVAVSEKASYPSVTDTIVKDSLMPLPPLSIQREIVARLERELAAVEKMKKGFETLAETAKAEFKAELKEVFEEISRGGAETRKLGEVCETITDGDHQPPPKTLQGVPFLVISNVATGRISFGNTRFVPRAYYEAIQENRKPRKGDVLLTVTGSYGIPVLVDTNEIFCFQRHIALLRASRLDSQFLVYALLSPESKRYFDLVATGAAQKTIGLASIRAMSIPFPSVPVQREVVARLDGAKAKAEKLEAKAREGVAVCETMRKAILKEAFE